MRPHAPRRIGSVRGDLPAPCAAAALSSLTGRSVRACLRVLARNHGRCPLESAVTPAILTSLADLGFGHALETHDPAPAFRRWAARASPGASRSAQPTGRSARAARLPPRRPDPFGRRGDPLRNAREEPPCATPLPAPHPTRASSTRATAARATP